MDHVAAAERGVSVDVAVADQPGAVADPHVRTDIAQGTDLDAVAEDRAVLDDAGGMDFSHGVSPLLVKLLLRSTA